MQHGSVLEPDPDHRWNDPYADIRSMPIEEVVSRIATYNDTIRALWSHAYGWAPDDAAGLLARARLDRVASLSLCLSLWTEAPEVEDQRDGALILGWANLGALTEGTMQWFLSVYRDDYPEDERLVMRDGKRLEPDALVFERLRQLFARHVWTDSEKERWDEWLDRIQARRNSIHAYRDREIGDLGELHRAMREYLAFLRELEGRTPG
ncbi:MAG: hypothetical protein AAF726_24945 [Planctomycetota bacterium]